MDFQIQRHELFKEEKSGEMTNSNSPPKYADILLIDHAANLDVSFLNVNENNIHENSNAFLNNEEIKCQDALLIKNESVLQIKLSKQETQNQNKQGSTPVILQSPSNEQNITIQNDQQPPSPKISSFLEKKVFVANNLKSSSLSQRNEKEIPFVQINEQSFVSSMKYRQKETEDYIPLRKFLESQRPKSRFQSKPLLKF
jgi:hypothetical protein